MKYRHLIALTALLTHTAHGALSAPMPAFKTVSQLATWRAEMSAKPTSHGDSAEESAFFTGKPYIDASGGYAFKYRSYNPELARWTSEDSSGFPDGANGNIYAPTPNSELDYAGLWTRTYNFTGAASYSGKPFNALNPGISGTWSVEMDDLQTHFTKPPTVSFGDKTGDWVDEILKTNESATFTTGLITQTNAGTEDIAGQTAWKKDWIEIKITLALKVIELAQGHLTTSNDTKTVYTTKIYGEKYE